MRPVQQWISSALTAVGRAAAPPPAGDGELSPELADVARLARRLVRQAVTAARAEEGSVRHLLTSHLGPQVATFRVASGSWPRYDHVNVQAALDVWLGEPGREHEITGIARFHHSTAGLADLAAPGPVPAHRAATPGSVTTLALPSGPGGATRPCVQSALYLVTDPGGPLVILVRTPEEHGPVETVLVEVACAGYDRGQRVVAEIRRQRHHRAPAWRCPTWACRGEATCYAPGFFVPWPCWPSRAVPSSRSQSPWVSTMPGRSPGPSPGTADRPLRLQTTNQRNTLTPRGFRNRDSYRLRPRRGTYDGGMRWYRPVWAREAETRWL